jgi:cytochrome c oxidase subunit 2
MDGFAPSLTAASAHAAHVDTLVKAFSALILALAGPVIVLMFVFAIRYRRGKPANREHAPDRNVALEVSWTIVPFLLIVGFFVVSARMFFTLHEPPANAMPSNGCGSSSIPADRARSTCSTCPRASRSA